jgi:HAD superfamily hydrolase (TIGR01549 family)
MRWQAVIFDVFGTLIPISTRHSPYRLLMKWMCDNGRRPQPEDAEIILSRNFDLRDIGAIFGMALPNELLIQSEKALQLELSNMHVYADVRSTLALLKRSGVRIGLCSNLATAYGDRVMELLPEADAYTFSFNVGAVKPAPDIYHQALEHLGVQAKHTLFIGDTPSADVEGPQQCGMTARLLDRKAGQCLDDLLL